MFASSDRADGLEPGSVFVGSDRSGPAKAIGSDERQGVGRGQRLLPV